MEGTASEIKVQADMLGRGLDAGRERAQSYCTKHPDVTKPVCGVETRKEDAERRALSCQHSHDVLHKYYQKGHVVPPLLGMALDIVSLLTMSGDLKKLLCKSLDFLLASTFIPHQLFLKDKFNFHTKKALLSDSALTLKKIL